MNILSYSLPLLLLILITDDASASRIRNFFSRRRPSTNRLTPSSVVPSNIHSQASDPPSSCAVSNAKKASPSTRPTLCLDASLLVDLYTRWMSVLCTNPFEARSMRGLNNHYTGATPAHVWYTLDEHVKLPVETLAQALGTFNNHYPTVRVAVMAYETYFDRKTGQFKEDKHEVAPHALLRNTKHTIYIGEHCKYVIGTNAPPPAPSDQERCLILTVKTE